MSRRQFKDLIRFFQGFISDRPELDAPIDYAAKGSVNALFIGQGEPVPFNGLAEQSGIGGIFGSPVSGGVGGFAVSPVGLVVINSLSPDSGVAITVSPNDINGNSNGVT